MYSHRFIPLRGTDKGSPHLPPPCPPSLSTTTAHLATSLSLRPPARRRADPARYGDDSPRWWAGGYVDSPISCSVWIYRFQTCLSAHSEGQAYHPLRNRAHPAPLPGSSDHDLSNGAWGGTSDSGWSENDLTEVYKGEVCKPDAMHGGNSEE